ncbi:MAG TPA: hypothetical protein VGS96_20775 [Thermoanaerobaculia bacterium]|jgi:hypothetical protein|nr:hypothetical protein [Thermoanaerobaculia bacterium]
MKFKNLITAVSIALLPLAASAATLIVPAAASTDGANGSRWQSELTLHNTANRAIVVTLVFHDQSGPAETATVTVPARNTVALTDVVHTKFNRDNSLGAIEINIADADANRIAVASHTSDVAGEGEFGQDIPAVKTTDAATAGDLAVITGPSSAADFRFNAGVYALENTTVRWDLVHADGTVAQTKALTYQGGTQNQYSVPALFGIETLQDNDVLHAAVTSGSAIFYGSLINEKSGDPFFVPGIRTREESRINFAGIDRDENGSVDIAAHDNVLSAPVDSFTYGFPTYFRIVATADTGEKVTYQIVSSTADARLIDDNGTVQMVSSAALAGKTGELKVRATTPDGQSVILTIPVKFF